MFDFFSDSFGKGETVLEGVIISALVEEVILGLVFISGDLIEFFREIN